LREDLEYRFGAVIECVLSDASRDDTGGSLPPKLFHYTSPTAAKSIAAEGSLRAAFDDGLLVFGPGVHTTEQAPPGEGPQLVEENTRIPDASFVFEFDSHALENQAYHIKDTRFAGYAGEGGFYTILQSLDLGGSLPYAAYRWEEAQGWEQVRWHAATGEFRRVAVACREQPVKNRETKSRRLAVRCN
jgi:hypothetical protein